MVAISWREDTRVESSDCTHGQPSFIHPCPPRFVCPVSPSPPPVRPRRIRRVAAGCVQQCPSMPASSSQQVARPPIEFPNFLKRSSPERGRAIHGRHQEAPHQVRLPFQGGGETATIGGAEPCGGAFRAHILNLEPRRAPRDYVAKLSRNVVDAKAEEILPTFWL